MSTTGPAAAPSVKNWFPETLAEAAAHTRTHRLFLGFKAVVSLSTWTSLTAQLKLFGSFQARVLRLATRPAKLANKHTTASRANRRSSPVFTAGGSGGPRLRCPVPAALAPMEGAARRPVALPLPRVTRRSAGPSPHFTPWTLPITPCSRERATLANQCERNGACRTPLSVDRSRDSGSLGCVESHARRR
ncbi:hypothetical protein AOLI_G00210110 [Acnodon oligacanthus]